MKKIICSALILGLVLGTVFAQSMNATVVSVSGKAERQAGDTWIPLAAGDTLNAGTLISTGFKSSVSLKFDGSVLNLAPLSRLTLSQLVEQEDSRDSSVYLDAGKISANIKSSDDKRVKFTVNSPVATASVRGTAGEVDVLGNVKSTESVWQVQPVNKNGEAVAKPVPVSKGMSTQVHSDGTGVKPPVAVTLAENTGASTIMEPPSADSDSDFTPSTFASDTIKSAAAQPANDIKPTAATINVSLSFE